MTLRRRLGGQIAGMVCGVALLGACAVIGVRGLHQDMGLAVRANEQLRQVYAIGLHVASAKSNLDDTEPHSSWRACDELRAAITLLDAFETQSSGAPWISGTSAQASTLRAALNDSLRSASGQTNDPNALNRCLASLADLSARTRTVLTDREAAAQRKHHATLLAVSLLSSAAIVVAIVLGIRQYRGVTRPLGQIQRAVRRIAAGDLREQISPIGDEEFTALAADFNRMASELKDLYDQLERRVEIKSRQLVQSERLASVGYLAAGVAHEINNPLGIITGYGERLMRRLKRDGGGGGSVDGGGAGGGPGPSGFSESVCETIGVMCDEAFRCKQITDRLLMLARGGDEARRTISPASVVRDVINSVRGLPRFADRQITLDTDDHRKMPNTNLHESRESSRTTPLQFVPIRAIREDSCSASPPLAASQSPESMRAEALVHANEGELRQVLLNLIVNALDAAPSDGKGAVRVSIRTTADNQVELRVTDNGRGMSESTLARIFEPFFTEKRADASGEGRPIGTGLGLSVVHAIVTDHGGRIEAHSAGVGRGSEFVVRLPVAAVAGETTMTPQEAECTA